MDFTRPLKIGIIKISKRKRSFTEASVGNNLVKLTIID